jgi:hypothetical protein
MAEMRRAVGIKLWAADREVCELEPFWVRERTGSPQAKS